MVDDKPRVVDWAKDSIDREKIFLRTLGFRSYAEGLSALVAYKNFVNEAESTEYPELRETHLRGNYVNYLIKDCGMSPENAAKLTLYVKRKSVNSQAALQMLEDKFGIKICNRF